MSKKKIIWIIIILTIVFGGYFYFKGKAPKIEYTTADVTRGDLTQTVSVTGKVSPDEQADLSFKSGGRLASVNFDVGEPIIKGDKVATIDAGDLSSRLAQAQAEIKFQKKTLDNMQKRKDVYNKDQRDAQRANIAKAEEAYNIIVEQSKDLSVYAPIDGTVVKRYADPGENISANAIIISIAKSGDLLVESNIPESDISKVKINQAAEIDFDAFSPEEKFEATVSDIEPAATVIEDVVYYKTKLRLASIDERLKVGMSANIDIKTAEKDNVLMAPMRAVQTENSQKFVQLYKIIETTVSIEKVKVETGLEGDEGMVEITSGLKEGDKVVTFTKNGK